MYRDKYMQMCIGEGISFAFKLKATQKKWTQALDHALKKIPV